LCDGSPPFCTLGRHGWAQNQNHTALSSAACFTCALAIAGALLGLLLLLHLLIFVLLL
jgi:hypothetical protein